MDFFRRINKDKYPDAVHSELPEYPARVLAAHVGMKGLEAGSLVGFFVITPILKVLKKPLTYQPVWKRAMVVTPLLGVCGACGLLIAKASAKDSSGQPMDEDGVDDRAYRILRGKQPAFDKAAMVGGVMGVTWAVLGLRGLSTASLAATGAAGCTGVALGLVVFKASQLLKSAMSEKENAATRIANDAKEEE